MVIPLMNISSKTTYIKEVSDILVNIQDVNSDMLTFFSSTSLFSKNINMMGEDIQVVKRTCRINKKHSMTGIQMKSFLIEKFRIITSSNLPSEKNKNKKKNLPSSVPRTSVNSCQASGS